MVCAKLESVLDENEITQLSETVRNKIDEVLRNQSELLDDLKNENCELRAVSERQQFQFEKEIFHTQERLTESSNTCVQLKTKVAKLEESLNASQKKVRELQSSYDASILELQSIRKSNDLLCEEKKGLVDQIEKTRAEIDKLNAEVKTLLEQATNADEARCEAIASAEEAKMKESNLQHNVKRLEFEKELLNKQINDLNSELSQKNHEIHTLKREKSSNTLELKLQLEQRSEEAHLLQKQVADLKKINEEKDRRVEGLAERIRGMNQTHSEAEEHFNLELRAQTKLATLYKQSSEDAQQRVQELVRGFEEIQKLLQETQQAHEALETSKLDMEEQYKSKLEIKDSELTKIREELKNANDLLTQNKGLTPESLEIMFPTAAATSRVLRSGMTLTQMYSEYVKAQEEVQQHKHENLQLTQQLQQLVEEINENGPVINHRMNEYHKAMETISCLRTQLASSLTDQEHLQSERDDAKRIRGQLERTVGRLRTQVSDLNRQVQVLLKEIEEARGSRRVRMGGRSSGDNEVSSTDETSSSRVISRHLVTFRDIEEIQARNQQLLAAIRDLSEQQEEMEKNRAAEDRAKMQDELKKATAELEKLQEARVKQAELVETVIRQRDMYRVLLTNQGYSESLLGSPFMSSTPMPGEKTALSPRDSRIQEARSALKQLQMEFDTYKKEKAENTKILNEQLEKAREEASELRVKTAKLTSQLEYAEERLNLLRTNFENSKKENANLREQNQKHTTLVAQHQQTITTLSQDVVVAHEKLAKAEVTVENLKAEKELLKGMEARLLQEKEVMIREQHQQSRVLAKLQTVQNNLERIESETQRNLKNQLDKLEKENAVLRSKVENAHEDYRSAVKLWEKENKELKLKLEKETERYEKVHGELVDAYAELHKVKLEASAAKHKAQNSEAQLEHKAVIEQKQSAQSASSAAEVKRLKDQLNESENRYKVLKEKLELTEKSCEQFRTMAGDMELQMKEQTEINKHLQTEMEKNLEQANAAKENLEKCMEDMEKTNRQLLEDNMKLSQEKSARHDDLLKRVVSLERELEAARLAKTEAERTATLAREECQDQFKLMQETQDNYERELTLRAKDLEQLKSLKEVHQECEKRLDEIASKQHSVEQELAASKTSWAEREKLLLDQAKVLTERAADFQKQYENVLHQLELMGTQMAAIKNWSEESSSTVLSGDTKDTQHLLQVVQFIKKEKEIASTECDLAQSESVRLKIKVEQLTSELSALKSELNEMQQNSEAQASSNAQHADLLRKIEMMNLLKDSNQLLRKEKEDLLARKKELEEKVKQLEAKIVPLEAENKALSSKVELSASEIQVLKVDVKNWQTRAQDLIEQAQKIAPQEYKNLTNQIDELKRQKTTLAEELQKKQSEAVQLNSSITQLKKNLEAALNEKAEAKNEVTKKTAENVELQKTITQVKKIGRKYKAQFDDIKVAHDDLKVAHDELLAKSAVSVESATQEQNQELQKKCEEMENKHNEELYELQEKLKKAEEAKEVSEGKLTEKDEKMKKMLTQFRCVHNQHSADKARLQKEIDTLQSKKTELEATVDSLKQTSEEENARNVCVKNQLESKIASLEKELNVSKETVAELQKQNEELNQKFAQQQKQVSKPAAVAALTERGSGTSSEPLTANIKPLAAPAPASVSGGLRHGAHPHAATPSARSTPTASIRPMAIGSVASSSAPQTRMAAVLPTTVTSVTTPIEPVEEADIPSVTPQPSTVPQATVQPTPATATAATVRTTVAATGTLQSHPPVISEVSPAAGETETAAVPGEPVQSHLISSAGSAVSSPATALVSPRIEGADTSPEGLSVDAPAPTTSVIVSPPATQVVTPTVKRPREDIETPSPSECTEGSVHLQKRVRMVSEGSQTNQQLSSGSTTASNVAVATVVSRKMPSEIVSSETQAETRDKQQFAEAHSSASSLKADVEASSSKSGEKDVSIEVEGKEVLEWETIESTKPEETDIEVMEDDQVEEFEDMQGVTFSSRSAEDEDMVDESIEESEEMADQQPSDCIEIIDAGDSNSDHQMEADSSSLQAPPSDQTMAPPSSLTPQDLPVRTESSSMCATVEPIAVQSSPSHTQRPPFLPRVPSRQERLTTSVRQHLPLFTIPGQGPNFEEGDDSIVPSTPTLAVPRRNNDGFAEAVSSPHVPQVRFLFSGSEGGSPSQQGLSQLASQGALGVDDTRMDLSQFDEGGGRTVPSTPLQVSPPDTVEPEVPEVPLTEQPSSPHVHESTVPTIKIDAPESTSSEISEAVEPADQSKSALLSTSDEANLSQEDLTQSEQDKEVNESQSVITSVSTTEGDGPNQPSSEEQKASVSSKASDEEGTEDSQPTGSSSQNQSQQRKPIVWKDRSKGRTSPQQSQFPTPSAHPSTSAPRASRSQRGGRRIRFRSSSGYNRAPGIWGHPRRGHGGRGGRMF